MARNTSALEKCSDDERVLVEETKKELLQSFATLAARCRVEGTTMYHPNQEATAMEVANVILYDPNVVFQLVKAMTQTGKTGCMLAVIELCFTLSGCDIVLNPDNIFIITGINSIDWAEQTKKRFPKALKGNIYHRGELKTKLAQRLAGNQNVLILMDEVHVAAKDGMTISKLLEETGLKDMDYLREKNINFVEFSATPNMVMDDMSLWEKYAKQHVMQPGTGYKGIRHQLENGRVFQAKDFFIKSNPDRIKMTEEEYNKRKKLIAPAYTAIGELKEKIISYYEEPLYHIIRLPSGAKFDEVVSRFKEVFGDDEFYHAPCHSTAKSNDVQNLIKDTPAKHTLIYIKEHLRCAVTLAPKTNIGILYDRVSDNDDVMIQGLAGRATGYDVPDKMLVYTNIESLERYLKVWESGFTDLGDFTYQGMRIKTPKKTVFHPAGFANSGIESRVKKVSPSGAELNFALELSEEDHALVTPSSSGKRVSKKNAEAAMEIIKRDAPEKWEKYGDYKPQLWVGAEKAANYAKWGVASLMTPGSVSTTTNVTVLYRSENILKMYVISTTKQLIVSPWSGEKTKPPTDISGGAAEEK